MFLNNSLTVNWIIQLFHFLQSTWTKRFRHSQNEWNFSKNMWLLMLMTLNINIKKLYLTDISCTSFWIRLCLWILCTNKNPKLLFQDWIILDIFHSCHLWTWIIDCPKILKQIYIFVLKLFDSFVGHFTN